MSMMKKRDYDYFDVFVRGVEYSCQAAKLLHDSLNSFDPDALQATIKDMHTIEHAADIAKHDMMSHLARAFMTPIEREDILQLAQEIDDVTDGIEDVLLRIYMYNILSIRAEAVEFTTLILRCCQAMKDAMKEFHNFRKSGSIHENIVEVNRLEEEGDALYSRAVRKLFLTSRDPIELTIWREMFDRLEKCCDACEHVANAVESVVMKNT